MSVPATVNIIGDPGKPGFRVICNRCNGPVERWTVETPIARAPFDPSNTLDCVGAIRMANTGEIILTVECHGEKFRASNWMGIEQ